MAPHDTNPPKQAKRHAVPLIGMIVCVVVVAVGFFWYVSSQTADPGGTEPAAEIGEPGAEIGVEPAN